MNSQILKAEKREIRTRWGHLALPYISKHFSWRSLMPHLEIVTANFGNHFNKAATSSRQNFCNVCFQPTPDGELNFLNGGFSSSQEASTAFTAL